MIMLTAWKNLMKKAFLQKKNFIQNSRVKVLQMKTTSMLIQFGRNLILSQWRITTNYNLSDVLLLADIFENLLMLLVIESGIRGGIATISHRHAKANNEQLSLLLRKDVYPYDYVDSMKKIYEASQEKPIPKDAYSKLRDQGITDEDYQHAQTVWQEFNIQSMKNYITCTISLMYWY